MTQALARKISKRWRHLFALIPNYDPIATAIDCTFQQDDNGYLTVGDCWFDEEAAELAIAFFPECLTHVKGILAHQPFALEQWQQAVIGCLYGWKRPDGTRRYRKALLFVPRKNGKTTMAAGLALRSLVCDGEPGAEIYCAAAERDQATLVFGQASHMVTAEPWIDSQVTVYKKSILHNDTGGIFKAISADANTKHGFNAHLTIVDELHAQPNPKLVDVLETGTGSRTEPLTLLITTSDYERLSICNETHDYACKVRDAIIEDFTFLPVIFEITGDDIEHWTDPNVWRKANPNLGISLSMDYMFTQCKEAQESPRKENTFKRLHLNIRTEQESRFVQMVDWDACTGAANSVELIGQPCYGGLDLASIRDVAAFVLYFPDTHAVLSFFWIPASRAEERERRQRVPYTVWERQGLLKMTEGNVIDYATIKADILALGEKYGIRDIGADRWNLEMMRQEIAKEKPEIIVPFGQGFRDMSAPTKELERLIYSRELAHGANPVLRWMASNMMVMTDPAGNIKPKKPEDANANKIDGIVALVMAIGRATEDDSGSGQSVYEDRGLIILGNEG